VAIDFSGGGQLLYSGGAPGATFSVGAHFRRETASAQSAWETTDGGSNHFRLAISSSGEWLLVNNGSTQSTGITLALNTWAFVLVACSGSTSTLYQFVHEGGARSTFSGTYATPTGAFVFQIGKDYNTGAEWADQMDGVRVWTAVVPDWQVALEARQRIHLRGENLWASWPLRDSGDMLVDYGPSGRTLAGTGHTTYAPPPVPWRAHVARRFFRAPAVNHDVLLLENADGVLKEDGAVFVGLEEAAAAPSITDGEIVAALGTTFMASRTRDVRKVEMIPSGPAGGRSP
jgi:hypothetical protein